MFVLARNSTFSYKRKPVKISQVAEELGVPMVVARPEFVYGPGDTHVLGLFQAIQRGTFFYMGSGECLCHPTYIDDAVAGLTSVIEPILIVFLAVVVGTIVIGEG